MILVYCQVSNNFIPLKSSETDLGNYVLEQYIVVQCLSSYCMMISFLLNFRMRIFWMRLVWTATAITYSVVVVYYKQAMYDLKSNSPERNQFVVDGLWIATLAIACFEYFFLGCLECFVKMMSFEKILKKIRKNANRLPKKWEKLQVYTYYLCLFAYAIRNFSFSLYFGLISVYVNFDDFISKNPYTGITVVLQIYLAMVRGRFYGLFMHALLSIFFVEDDDDTYKQLQQDDDASDDANGEVAETKLLTETRRRHVGNDPEDSAKSELLQDLRI